MPMLEAQETLSQNPHSKAEQVFSVGGGPGRLEVAGVFVQPAPLTAGLVKSGVSGFPIGRQTHSGAKLIQIFPQIQVEDYGIQFLLHPVHKFWQGDSAGLLTEL